ncbi:hypothetical protein LVJ94_12410 [Pendulispora rubella]|uniref:Uncharacterized protein n=1 Tax=Pendulispora rubella TaxID=2741070 RepID=A0ABZ2LAS5_9BACT
MKAWTVIPDAPWRVAIREVPPPIARVNEALVSVVAFGLDRDDVDRLCQQTESWIPGRGVAGLVLQAAADGSGPPRGARVVGLVDGGAWAERAAIPTAALTVVPPEVTLAQAAAALGEEAKRDWQTRPWDDLHGALDALDARSCERIVLCIPSGDVPED